jgi:ELWxxDGT repeat protein
MSDGTQGGTVRVIGLPGSASLHPHDLTNVNGTLYFGSCCASNAGGVTGLWKSDGSEAGTIQLSDASPRWLTNVNGTDFFHGFTVESGSELWKSDGTAAGTVMVKEINPSLEFSDYSPGWLTDVHGTVYFTSSDRGNNIELWKSDGTNALPASRDIGSFPAKDLAWDAAYLDRVFADSEQSRSGSKFVHGLVPGFVDADLNDLDASSARVSDPTAFRS